MPESPDTDELLICIECGYDLRHTPSNRCSECGAPFNPDSLKTSQLPWETSRSILSYFKTAWKITFARKQIRDEVRIPHDLHRAILFRRITGIAFALSFMAFLAISNAVMNISTGRELINKFVELFEDPTEPFNRLLFDFNLLMGVAFSGWSAYPILALLGWDWVRLPGTIVRKKGLSEPRKNRDQILGCYLTGPYAIALLWLWIGAGFLLLLRVLKIPDPFFTIIPGQKYSPFAGSMMMLSYLPFLMALVFIPIRFFIQLISWKRAVHQIRAWGTGLALFKLFCLGLWRVFFWLVWTPLFIGLIRLIVESLLWR